MDDYYIDEKKAVDSFFEIVPIEIVKKIIDQFYIKDSFIHGVSHWSRVFYYGKVLSELSTLDVENIAYFSIFHDSRRFNDDYDPEHGLRGAEFFRTFDRIIKLSNEQKEVIYEACKIHNYQKQSDSLEVGVCLDSDRVDLIRVGITPNNDYLHSIHSKNDDFKKTSKDFSLNNLKETKLSNKIISGIYDLNLDKKYDLNIFEKIKKTHG